MKYNISKIYVIASIYLLVLLAAFLLPRQISNFNYIFLILFTCSNLILFPLKKIFISSFLMIVYFTLLQFLLPESNYLYYINDLLTIVFIVECITIAQYAKIYDSELKILKYLFLGYLLLSLAYAAFSNNYEESRFLGLMQGTNLSASVSMILLVLVWEIEKLKNKNIFLLLFLTGIFFSFIFLYKTRTLLFALPYFIYQYTKYWNLKKVIIWGGIIAIPLILYNYKNLIFENFRLAEDSSFITRFSLYSYMYENLAKSHFILPHGFNSANNLIYNYSGENNYVHNDLFKYLYDWGGIFLIYIFFIIKRIIKPFDWNMAFILLLVLANSFHNMLFSVYIWIPFTIILLINKSGNPFIPKGNIPVVPNL